jgi:hypothetical protein
VLSPWLMVIMAMAAGIGAVRRSNSEYDGWLVR